MRWILVAALLACSSVSTNDPAADAPATSTECETFCVCAVDVCDVAVVGCLQACQSLETDVRDCRIIHCGLAEMAADAMNEPDRQMHCMHAQGIDLCQAN